MSVYRPKGSETFVFDFWRGGRRFSGSTGAKSERAAKQVEREKIDEAERQVKAAKRSEDGPMTLDVACDRYWVQVGQYAKGAKDIEWSIDYLLRFFGEQKLLREITDDDVSNLVSQRRSERVITYMPRKKKPTTKLGKIVSNATVNRSVLEPLRRIMLRARDKWKKEVGIVDWTSHRLPEPKERVRSLSLDEEQRLFAALPSAYHPIVTFAIRTGFRAMECINLRWSDIDWGDRRISVKGKGDKAATIPMPVDVRELLFPMRANGGEFVFKMPSGKSRMTYRAYYAAFKTAARKAGIVGLRVHDLRHTAATRLLRQKGNIKLVKELLRHEDIATTDKYAHTLDGDLRDALDEMVPMHEVPGKVPETAAKSLRVKG